MINNKESLLSFQQGLILQLFKKKNTYGVRLYDKHISIAAVCLRCTREPR